MALAAGMKDHVFYRNSKKSYPAAVRGEGIYIYDSREKRYIDGRPERPWWESAMG